MSQEHANDPRSTDAQRHPLRSLPGARKSIDSDSPGNSTLRQRIGNQGVQRLVEERTASGSPIEAVSLYPKVQTKLAISQPRDPQEQEADQIANAVMRVSAGEETAASSCVQRSETAAPLVTPEGAASLQAMRSSGHALPVEARAFFESRFGVDFSRVSVHTDERAREATQSLGAKAFTIGRDIAFGPGQYAPDSREGRRLLAHELTHVVQQAGGGSRVDRQADVGLGQPRIPTDLQSSTALRSMTMQALQDRYDRIVSVLSRFDRSTPDTALLDRQLVDISNELARRLALEQGRTFDPRVIDLMREYLVENAKTERDSCIVCMNKGIRKLLEDPNQKLTPESVDATMEMLRVSGRASEAREIGFLDVRGRVTRGGGRPNTLRESVAKALLEMVAGDVGWSVFGMSLLDGYHSVMLTVDTNDPSSQKIYWSDQWKSKGGWKEYSQADLDQEITRLIQGWWDDQPAGKKHKTIVRLWRLRR